MGPTRRLWAFVLSICAGDVMAGSTVARADGSDAAGIVRAACRAESDAPQRIEIAVPPIDWRDGALTVDLGRAVSLDGGTVELFPAAGEEEGGLVPVPMSAEQAAVFVRARAQERLVARLGFVLSTGALAGAPCLSLAGGRILRARYRPLRLELFDLGTEEGKARRKAAIVLKTTALIEAERATPSVQIGPATLRRSDEPSRAALERGLAEAEPALRRCYARALDARPQLAGRLVLGGSLERGRFAVARVELDSVGDPSLAVCARAAVEGASAPAGLRLGSFSLPIGFVRR